MSRCGLGLALIASLAALPGCQSLAPVPVAVTPEESRFAADLDRFVTDALARFPTVPAMGVAVSRSRGPIVVRSHGVADREAGRAAGADTLFYIASSTKSFVGLAFARLEQQGLIDLDWTLAELAPEIRFAPEVRAREVTLRHLLSHSHGLVHGGIEFRLAYSGEHDTETLWRLLATLRPNARAPLGTFSYGNLGFNVAALLVERRLGVRWQDLVAREVFGPLGLRHTMAQGIGRPGLPLTAPYAGEARLNVVKSDATMQSAGGIYATMDDLARWVGRQLAAQRGGGAEDAVIALTHRPVVRMEQSFGPFARRGYGLGWYSGPYRGETLYHSFGSYVGARAHTSFMPSRDLGVAIMTNDEEAGFLLTDVIAAYAYDWFMLGPEPAAAAGRESLARLEEQVARHRQSTVADRARRASRAWRLTLPAERYRGRYCNEERGTIEIGGTGTPLEARMGLLRVTPEPFTEPDSARVEFIPNSGQVLQFAVENGRVTGLEAGGLQFRRCG